MKKWIIAICAVLGSTAFAQEAPRQDGPMLDHPQQQLGAQRQQQRNGGARSGQGGGEDRLGSKSHSLTGGTETNQKHQQDAFRSDPSGPTGQR